ncbi:hypothetical protein L21SP2_2094 [Salinispira pacifica]|uniref:Uncharacterized protein n=1 Tax=Salinispira pacifica TaxID=1307761 RepID=V5WJV7_9SPIO|nr:hypothetical protein L21SP2_2094 [Salinispira pacifica]
MIANEYKQKKLVENHQYWILFLLYDKKIISELINKINLG